MPARSTGCAVVRSPAPCLAPWPSLIVNKANPSANVNTVHWGYDPRIVGGSSGAPDVRGAAHDSPKHADAARPNRTNLDHLLVMTSGGGASSRMRR